MQNLLHSELKSLILRLKTSVLPIQSCVNNKVQYYSQFASPEYAEKVLKHGVALASDPNWEESGAKKVKEYEKWALTTCGMACTAMALDFYLSKQYKTVELAISAQNAGVYIIKDGELSGLRYQQYVKWLPKYGLKADLFKRLSLSGIKYLISKGSLAMVSVSPNIRGCQTAPDTQVGGHLVLVTGYNEKQKTITISNPSGFVSLSSHDNHVLAEAAFNKHFAGRGIALHV